MHINRQLLAGLPGGSIFFDGGSVDLQRMSGAVSPTP